MNQVILIGNLTKDPEVRGTTGGSQTAVCRFTVAVNERRRNSAGEWEDSPSFIPVVAFGKLAEICERYLTKGRKVAVSGRIQTGSYTNKEGRKIYTTDVIADNIEFLGSRGDDQHQTVSKPEAPEEEPGFYQLSDDDIPF